MVSFIKKQWVSFVAVLLALVVGGYFLLANNRRENTVAEIRTVQVSGSSFTYLNAFEKYDIIKNENSADFSGVLSFNENFITAFNNVALNDIADYNNYKIITNSSFDIDKMQFTFSMQLVDEEGNIVDQDSLITDAFVTENGGLDAYIEIEGETYLLSEYQTLLQNSINQCGLFGWLVATIVIVVVTYVIVAETAEQIRAKSNYEYNKQLESNGNGVSRGNYITNQSSSSKGYNSAGYRFGFTTFSGVGCEVAAIYNLMIALGKTEMLSETINNVEKWAIEFSVGWGKFGSNPYDIYRYLNKKGVSYAKYTSYDTFKSALDKKSNCKIIMASWNQGGLFSGMHVYFINKVSNNLLRSYNAEYRTTYQTYSNMDQINSLFGSFILAYVVN